MEPSMQLPAAEPLRGLHHVTMFTADGQRCIDFHAGVLGLRLVKQTVNFDAPDMYHLYLADEQGTPGSVLTWFEVPGARRGRAGAGMVHRIILGVPSEEARSMWQGRLRSAGVEVRVEDGILVFEDPDGLGLGITVDERSRPLVAQHPDIAPEHAITGVSGVRAYAVGDDPDAGLLAEALGFAADGAPGRWRVGTAEGHPVDWAWDPAPEAPGLAGAGTVHHIAWCTSDASHEDWRSRLVAAGLRVSPVLDRDYFRSIYAQIPSGVLFELATESPGFAIDEAPDELGSRLQVPEMHAHLDQQIRSILRPLVLPGQR